MYSLAYNIAWENAVLYENLDWPEHQAQCHVDRAYNLSFFYGIVINDNNNHMQLYMFLAIGNSSSSRVPWCRSDAHRRSLHSSVFQYLYINHWVFRVFIFRQAERTLYKQWWLLWVCKKWLFLLSYHSNILLW